MNLNLVVGEDDTTPLYQQLANRLRDRIADGSLREGHSLPSERMLTEMTGMSRITVRKGIAELIREGLLFRKQGSGTYVCSRIESPATELNSFSKDAKVRGEASSDVWIARAYAAPTEEEALELCIAQSQQVARLGRIRLLENEPLAIEHAVVPAKFLPDLSALDDGLYSALSAIGMPPVSGSQRIRASLATPTEAGMLGIRENAEVLRIKRVTKAADGTVLEYTRSTYRGDRYDIVSEISISKIQEQSE